MVSPVRETPFVEPRLYEIAALSEQLASSPQIGMASRSAERQRDWP